jgi:hypothetical protein
MEIRTCDPLALQQRLTWGIHGYYGHFPAMVLGMHWYYRIAPALVLIGLWVLLRRHGMVTVFTSWVALFFICRTVAFDLHNGTFVGIINFYFWGFILIRSVADWIGKHNSGIVPSILASFMVFFHAFTGVVMFAGVILYAIIARKLPPIFVSFLLGVSVLASYVLLPSTISRVDQIPQIVEAVSDNPLPDIVNSTTITADVGKFVEYPTMDLLRFVSEYVGFGLWVYFLLAGIVATQLWTHRDNFPKDRALRILLVMCIPLVFMTFSPFALNADRTAKLLVGILTILATVIIVDGLAMRKDKRLYGIAGVLALLSLAYELPKLVPYWMNMGSWQ